MDPARPGSLLFVGGEEAGNLIENPIEMPCLVATLGGVSVPVHRVACPHDWVSGIAHRSEKWWQVVANVVGTLASDEGKSARDLLRVESFAQGEHLVRCRRRADLAAERVLHAPKELDMGAVELSGALADQSMWAGGVPVAGERILRVSASS